MRVVVFSGTTEGRVFSKQLAALGAEVLVSVATPLGGRGTGRKVRHHRLLRAADPGGDDRPAAGG